MKKSKFPDVLKRYDPKEGADETTGEGTGEVAGEINEGGEGAESPEE